MIEINNLSKIFNLNSPQEVVALSDVSFFVKKGEIINIIGESGSGKTTLINLLLGIIKPTSGKIIIDNELLINNKTKSKKLKLITNKLLSSFQFPDHQLFTKTVYEELLFNSNNEKLMFELMKRVDLPTSILNESPFKISSGQKRKVILISLLIQEPSILIFDEATSFLDATSRREFVALLKEINFKNDITILFISHNLIDVKNLTKRTILLEKGKLVFDGNTNDALNNYIK